MILLLDNYDSFTYNLQQYLAELTDEEIKVYRNDEITLEEVSRFDRIVLSPGPGLPDDAGILIPLIKMYAPTKPMLGVCLGHQAIAQAFGSGLKRLQQVLHGIPREVNILKKENPLFNSLIIGEIFKATVLFFLFGSNPRGPKILATFPTKPIRSGVATA